MARDVDKIHSKPWRIYTLLALICASIPFTSLVFSLAFSNSNKQPIFFSTSINGTSLEFGVAGYCVVDENNTKTCSSWWSGELKTDSDDKELVGSTAGMRDLSFAFMIISTITLGLLACLCLFVLVTPLNNTSMMNKLSKMNYVQWGFVTAVISGIPAFPFHLFGNLNPFSIFSSQPSNTGSKKITTEWGGQKALCVILICVPILLSIMGTIFAYVAKRRLESTVEGQTENISYRVKQLQELERRRDKGVNQFYGMQDASTSTILPPYQFTSSDADSIYSTYTSPKEKYEGKKQGDRKGRKR